MLLIQFFHDHYLAIKPSTSPRTVTLYKATIRKFLQHLGRDPVLEDLENTVVGRYLSTLHRSDLRTATVNKERYQLLAMWRLANRLGLVSTWPLVESFTEPERLPTALSVSQLKQLRLTFDQLNGKTGGLPNSDVIRAVFGVQYVTAERIGAVSQLKWTDVTGDTITFRAETRKGRRKAMIKAVPAWLLQELEPLKASKSELLFPGCYGTTKLHTLYARLFKRAGVARPKGKSSHLLRSTHATFVNSAGGDATQSLGHASDVTTRKSYLDPRYDMAEFWKMLPDLGA